eukprot:Anaeramoba_ignava/c18066_g1_i2.p2 GENE.c18066_g1_i2~~c18066_g1_i2.p2  ORF type:complete len:125 (-),score=44.32 c18066_g1_i2:49-423(-)
MEPLFEPKLIGNFQEGLPNVISQSITKCEMDIRRSLYEGIILAGGTAATPLLAERLTQELSGLTNSKVKIVNEKNLSSADLIVWKGSSTLAALTGFEQIMISQQDYKENGAHLIFSEMIKEFVQ